MDEQMSLIKDDLERLHDVDIADLKYLKVIKLTKEEKLVLRKAKSVIDRKMNKLYKDKDKIIKNCKHDFRWVCSGHNDDAYDCIHCGETEWR